MHQVVAIPMFVSVGLGFVLAGLLAGWFLRPKLPNAQKLDIYECGEPTIGDSWVQFDLRFYVVALFYLVFDVEVALIWPWAVAYRQHALPALLVGAPFLIVIVVGFAYEWYAGSLDWVRSSVNTTISRRPSHDYAALARRDPEVLADMRDE